jgi:type IV pilus assembly protein PilA
MLQTINHKLKTARGFTLLEVLLVVGIIAVLAAIVIVAINPKRQMGQTRNAQRWSDVNTIINATYQYYIANGELPSSLTTSLKEICKTGKDCSGLVDLDILTDDQTYIVSMPYDPIGSPTNGAGYEIEKTSNDRVKVTAPDAELGETIEVIK